MNINIVNLKECPQHLETLASWHQQEWSYLNPGQTLEQRIEKMQAYLDEHFIPSTFVALDAENDELLGSAAIIESDMETRPELTPWLASVFVHPEKRCRGIGGELVKYVTEQAAKNQFSTLYLYTPDQEKFYQRLGWRVLESVNYHATNVVIMSIELPV